MPERFLAKVRAFLEGDPAVAKVAGDPALMAELLLLFRVALADGTIRDAEIAMIKRICAHAFDLAEDSFDQVVQYLQDFGYEVTGNQAAKVIAKLPYERKKQLVEHMEAIARADKDLDPREAAVIHKTIGVLNSDA